MPELVDRMASPDDVWPHDFREAVAELEPLPPERGIAGLAVRETGGPAAAPPETPYVLSEITR